MIKYNALTTELHNDENFIKLVYDVAKLNLGCNDDYREGYLNIDILDSPVYKHELDIVADVSKLFFIPTNSIKEILAYDILEHQPQGAIVPTLRDWIRTLGVKGKIVIRVPDLSLIAQDLLNQKLPIHEAQRLIYGGQEYKYNFHFAGFTGDYLEGLLISSGCHRILQRISGKDEDPKSYNITIVAEK